MSHNTIAKLVLGLAISSTSTLPLVGNAYATTTISPNNLLPHIVIATNLMEKSEISISPIQAVPPVVVHHYDKSTIINGIKDLGKSLLKGISTINSSITHSISHLVSATVSSVHQGIKFAGNGLSQLAKGTAQAVETTTGTIDGFLHIGPPLLLGNFPGGIFLSNIATSIGTAIATGGTLVAHGLFGISNLLSPPTHGTISPLVGSITSNSRTIQDNVDSVPDTQLIATPVDSSSKNSTKLKGINTHDQNLIATQIISPNVSLLD